MGVRRFRALFDGLPASSRAWIPEHGGWTVTDHLLATNAELTHGVYRAIWAGIPTKRPVRIDPLVIPRPGDKPKKRRKVNPVEFMQMVKEATSG